MDTQSEDDGGEHGEKEVRRDPGHAEEGADALQSPAQSLGGYFGRPDQGVGRPQQGVQ